MREIKFRGFHKPTKRMIDLKAITPLALDSKLDRDGLFLPFDDNIELMQFTGLKDKNGKEIFEGDIIKTDSFVGGMQNFIIEWDEYGAWWQLKNVNNAEDVNFAGKGIDEITIYSSSEWKREIIGNVFENPELSEVK